MSDEEPQAQESEEPPASGDSDSVDAAMAGIPGLAESTAESTANRPARTDSMDEAVESEEEEPDPSVGTPRAPAEDSETVKEALKQFGLQ